MNRLTSLIKTLLIFTDDKCCSFEQNAIFGMVTLQDGTLLTAAGRELKVWDTMDSFKLIKERVVRVVNIPFLCAFERKKKRNERK